jgi:cytochrome c peroxidase
MNKLNHTAQRNSVLASKRAIMPKLLAPVTAIAAAVTVLTGTAAADTPPASLAAPPYSLQSFADPTGVVATFDVNGLVNESGAFFQSLGTNGRSCSTCHVATQAMSLSAKDIQARFAETSGQDPLFAPVDGANCPSARPGLAADHSLLLKHGLIRVFLPVPADAQFTVSVVHDPYGCAMVPGPDGGQPIVSVYRRPLPTTNLNFLSTIMFDGRETHAPLNNGETFATNLAADLTQQALDAITIHAQAAQPPSSAQLTDIVGFELGLFTAQGHDTNAGSLHARGALGGPVNLAGQPYYPGINDSLGADPTGAAFDPASMTLFAAWLNLSSDDSDYRETYRDTARRPVYLINGCPNPFNPGEPESFYTTDPGKALISGLCSDFNRGKGPILRGLAARAPYFHNGAAADLHELVSFYNQRFQMNLTEEQKQELVAFLNSL